MQTDVKVPFDCFITNTVFSNHCHLARVHACMHAHRNTHAHTHTHIHTYACAHTHMLVHVRAHVPPPHTHTHRISANL